MNFYAYNFLACLSCTSIISLLSRSRLLHISGGTGKNLKKEMLLARFEPSLVALRASY